MAFEARQIVFLQTLLAQRPQERPADGKSASYFAEHFGVGIRYGRRIEYFAPDFDNARQLLLNANLPLSASPNMRRAETAGFSGISEKAFSIAPHADSVAVKVAAGCCYDGSSALITSGRKYLVLPVKEALSISADRLMVVENMETFRDLERYRWIDYQGLDVLALFRGDPRLKIDEARAVIDQRTEPVWGFYDFDPAGLALVSALPRLERIIAPGQAWLDDAVLKAERFDLYREQLPQTERLLDAMDVCSDAGRLWVLMKSLGRGLPQEWMEEAHLGAFKKRTWLSCGNEYE
jgi:hypothetical protein